MILDDKATELDWQLIRMHAFAKALHAEVKQCDDLGNQELARLLTEGLKTAQRQLLDIQVELER
jgi:hypothetical protein